MAHNDQISLLTLSAQERMFRLAERDLGLSLKRIGLDSGIPYNTIRSYAANNGAQVMMPISAVSKLTGVIPDEYLSYLFEPVDRCLIATTDDADQDVDGLAEDADHLENEVRRARRPDSPGGSNIVPMERSAIMAKARKLASRVRAA